MGKPWSVCHYICWFSILVVILVIFSVLGFRRLKISHNGKRLKVTLQTTDGKFNQRMTLNKFQKYFTLTDESGKRFEYLNQHKFHTDTNGLLMTLENEYVKSHDSRLVIVL